MINRKDDRCVAQYLEVDVSSFGDTHDEAIAMITEALEMRFEEPRSQNTSIDLPSMVDLRIPT